jgi:hypothetical protein
MNRTNQYVEGITNSGEPRCDDLWCSNCIFSRELSRGDLVAAICGHYGQSIGNSACYWKNKAFLDGLVAFIEGKWYEGEQ